ncbi:hypothetical protein ACWD25_26580 [Streptomyces sp. NPDC002920]
MATTMFVSFGLVSVPVLVSPATEDYRIRLYEVQWRSLSWPRRTCGRRM